MDVRIIKNSIPAQYDSAIGDIVLQISEGNQKIGEITSKKYTLFYVDSNVREELAPDIIKYHIWSIRNLCPQLPYFYFTNCMIKNKNNVIIRLYRYHTVEKTFEIIYEVEDNISLYLHQKKTKIFLLDENYILIEHQYLKSNETDSYQGFLDFELFLYSMKEQRAFTITDDNFLQGGIFDIFPISKNICAIKIGYDLLEDRRFEKLKEKEIAVESIGFVNIKQMISDILVKQNNIFIDIVDQVKGGKTIPCFQVKDEYLIYSRVSRDGQEEVIYYNYNTKEAKACINTSVFELTDLAKAYISNGKPYILTETKKGLRLYNIIEEEIEWMFEKDSVLKELTDDWIVVEVKKKRLFRKAYSMVQVFQCSIKKVIVQERGHFFKLFHPKEDKLYLFIK